jgi:hypothetical protein
MIITLSILSFILLLVGLILSIVATGYQIDNVSRAPMSMWKKRICFKNERGFLIFVTGRCMIIVGSVLMIIVITM